MKPSPAAALPSASFRRQPGYESDVTGGSERCVYIVVLAVPHPTEPRNGNIASVRVAFQMTGKPIPKPTHTLTALDGFGNVLFTQTNEEGAALRLSAPTLDGYTFTGWTFATAGGTDLGQLAIMPACDVTATAQWTPIVTPEPVYTLYMDSGYEGGTLRGGGSGQARASGGSAKADARRLRFPRLDL